MTETQELRGLCSRIVASGVLGRSKIYARLLTYLVDCSINNRTPKEIEIAIEVMDRDANFDVAKDSLVRVYIHNLRRKLESYFSRHIDEESFIIEIPKGQYTLEIVDKAELSIRDRSDLQSINSWDWRHWLLGAALLLLISYVFIDKLLISSATTDSDQPLASVRSHPLWRSVLGDSRPLVLVLGDYYIFGEVDPATGEILRMVREFHINSKSDLETLFFQQSPEVADAVNLDLSYLPTSTAFALNDIIPVISNKSNLTSVRTMSEMNTAFLKTHHVVYVGYISGLAKLRTLVFQDSRFRIGETDDEIIDQRDGEHYFSGEGWPSPDKRFHDYGFVSTFPTPDGTQVLVIAGTRDGGLMHTARALAGLDGLNQLIESEAASGTKPALEALYEVFGYEGRNFDARLVATNQLDPQKIWSGDLYRTEAKVGSVEE